MLTTLLHLSSKLRTGGEGYPLLEAFMPFFSFCPKATLGIQSTEKVFKIVIVNCVSYVSRAVDSKVKPT